MKCFTGVHVPDPAVYFDWELVKGLGGGVLELHYGFQFLQ